METVEFIESYKKVGNDYQWNDNHGQLVRCRDCKYYENDEIGWCNVCSHTLPGGGWLSFEESDFCSYGERREDE